MAAAKRHDRLRVEDEPLFVDRVADAPDPGQRRELALDTRALGRLLGGVAEYHHDAFAVAAVEQRSCGVGGGEDGSVPACVGVVDDPHG